VGLFAGQETNCSHLVSECSVQSQTLDTCRNPTATASCLNVLYSPRLSALRSDLKEVKIPQYGIDSMGDIFLLDPEGF
jgi:hypothetical protein